MGLEKKKKSTMSDSAIDLFSEVQAVPLMRRPRSAPSSFPRAIPRSIFRSGLVPCSPLVRPLELADLVRRKVSTFWSTHPHRRSAPPPATAAYFGSGGSHHTRCTHLLPLLSRSIENFARIRWCTRVPSLRLVFAVEREQGPGRTAGPAPQ